MNGAASDSPSAFIPRRQTLDGSLIANEKEKNWWIYLQNGFQKAFDPVLWAYLLHVFCSIGFGRKWIAWIQKCIFVARMSILINGSPAIEFNLEKKRFGKEILCPLFFLIL